MRHHPVLIAVLVLSSAVGSGGAAAADDVADGYCLTYRPPSETSAATLEAAADKLDDRLGSMGIAGDAIADPVAGTVSVALKPGPDGLADARQLATDLGATHVIRFTPVPVELQGSVEEGPLPEAMQDIEPLFDASGVAYATVGEDPNTRQVVVDLELTDDAGRRFDEYAAEHVGDQFAIVIDEVVVSAPTINAGRFGGAAQISGNFTSDEARALAAALLSGALPLELLLDDVRACVVLDDLTVPIPLATLERAGEDLERPALQVATRLRDLGVEDFVITLHPESDQLGVTVLPSDPALVRPVKGVLPASWFDEVGDVAFTDDTLDAFLERLPDQPVALRWSGLLPDGTEWRPEKAALIGDPSELGTGKPADVDVDAVVDMHDRWEAWNARLTEVMEDPRFVGFDGSADGALVLLFARDSIADEDVQELSEELSGYGIPVSLGSEVSEVRGGEIDLTVTRVQEVRDTLADALADHGLGPDALKLQFHLDEKPDAFIELPDLAVEKSIRRAVRDRLGKGVVSLWFFDDDWIDNDGDDQGS